MNQTERIIYMETILNEFSEKTRKLFLALEDYETGRERLEELIKYYQSPLWIKDFEDDARGKFPQDLKRGVLSEDAVYNLLMEIDDLKEKLLLLAQKN